MCITMNYLLSTSILFTVKYNFSARDSFFPADHFRRWQPYNSRATEEIWIRIICQQLAGNWIVHKDLFVCATVDSWLQNIIFIFLNQSRHPNLSLLREFSILLLTGCCWLTDWNFNNECPIFPTAISAIVCDLYRFFAKSHFLVGNVSKMWERAAELHMYTYDELCIMMDAGCCTDPYFVHPSSGKGMRMNDAPVPHSSG